MVAGADVMAIEAVADAIEIAEAVADVIGIVAAEVARALVAVTVTETVVEDEIVIGTVEGTATAIGTAEAVAAAGATTASEKTDVDPARLQDARQRDHSALRDERRGGDGPRGLPRRASRDLARRNCAGANWLANRAAGGA